MTLVHADVISQLTIEQKAALTAGADFWRTVAVPEAGIRAVRVSDGPHGLRTQPEGVDTLGLGGTVPATCFPPAVGLASTWNPELARLAGEAIGREARQLNVDVVLGPGVNIKRSPLCGRNFEYFSEDPFVAGRLGAGWVQGVQSTGVGTSLKHFAANNQETERMRVSAQIDERTLREIYLSAFEHVVKAAHPTTVMCSYNRINGVYSAQNSWLLTEVLRREWGFDGLVMSDWGAVVDRVASVRAGLDLKMPMPGHEKDVVAAVAAGELDEAVLDQAIDRLLTLAERTDGSGPAAGEASGTDPLAVDEAAHHALARRVATEAAVLLKNENNALPLSEHGSTRIAVVGEFARTPRFQGAGSSQVVPTRVDAPLDALREILGDRVGFAAGFTFAADPAADAALLAEARTLVRGADHVVLFLGLPESEESEGFDRTTLSLPANQLALLDAVAALNRRVVVVLSNGSVVDIASWQGKARAILEGWLLGQAGGAAIADLLLGRANPSGKLAETIPVHLADNPSYVNFPGSELEVIYGERVYVGYRHYDTRELPVAYPFGHGLSYTSFAYSDLAVVPAAGRADGDADDAAAVAVAEFTVTNTGAVAGSEIVQLYRRDAHSAVDRPVHELVGFAKLELARGASQRVRIELDARAFAYWSTGRSAWVIDGGAFVIEAGASSRDLRLSAVVDLPSSGPAEQLSAMSPISTWLADPVGGAVLGAALAANPDAAGMTFDGSTAEGRMFLAIPLATALSMTPGAPDDAAEQLVAAVRAAGAER